MLVTLVLEIPMYLGLSQIKLNMSDLRLAHAMRVKVMARLESKRTRGERDRQTPTD